MINPPTEENTDLLPDPLPKKWYKIYFKFWHTVILVVIVIALYFGLKLIPTSQDSESYWGHTIHSLFEHMDLLGYILAIVALVVTLNVSYKLDETANINTLSIGQKTENIRQITENIKQTTENIDNLMKNVNAVVKNLNIITKTTDTLPQIIDSVTEISNTVTEHGGKFLIMNYTSRFGVIHSFNRRIISQICLDDALSLHDTKDTGIVSKVNLLRDKVFNLNLTISNAAKKLPNFKMITLQPRKFEQEFIQKYFKIESDQNENNFLYYEYGNERVSNIETGFADEILTSITRTVIQEHKKGIKDFKDSAKGNRVIRLADSIPYQMFLAEYTKNGEKQYESFLIYAIDEMISIDNKNKRRNFIGISSKSQNMYNAFETLFNEEFAKHSNNN